MSIAALGSSALPASAPAPNGSSGTEPVAHGFAAVLAGAIAPQVHVETATAATKKTSDVADDGNGDVTDASGTDNELSGTAAAKTGGPDLSLAALGAAGAGLNPVLKAKLARVIDRMHTEFGRDVRLVEGVRSQDRQNQLFAQGRDTAGPVVTWTRNSLHTAGRAADLVINGGYDDTTGFALLRQVAEQEGLHTLGAKDPGHLELRGTPTTADTATAGSALVSLGKSVNALAGTLKPASRDTMIIATTSMGRVATPAAVAGVATLARIATVARIAQVGAAQATAATKAATSPSNSAAPIVPPGGRSDDGQSHGNGQSGANRDGSSRRPLRADPLIDGSSTDRGVDAYRALDALHTTGGLADGPTTDALSDARSGTASRMMRAMDLQDSPGPRTLSQITLSLDDGSGGQDQIRVGMRGGSVGASFDMSNTASADRVSSRLGELTKALEQRGLEPQSFQVRAASTARDSDAARVSTVATGAQRAVADSSATRNDSQSTFGGDARQRFSHQSDQQEQAQRRQADQRRRGYSFSLNTEES